MDCYQGNVPMLTQNRLTQKGAPAPEDKRRATARHGMHGRGRTARDWGGGAMIYKSGAK